MTAYLRSIWLIRHFWFLLVCMDVRSRYRGSILGLGWSMLQPIAMTVILTVVFSTLFGIDRTEYAPYLMCGLTCWAFINIAAIAGCNCYFQAESYIRQVPAPLAIYPLRTVLAQGFHFGIGIMLVLALRLTLPGTVSILPLLSMVPSTLLLLLFGWSLAVLFGLANVRFRDTHHLTEVGLQALYYLTPIMYKPDLLIQKGLGLLIYLNPVVPFLNLYRIPILDGRFPDPMTYACAGLVTATAVGLAGLALRRCERQLIFHL